MEFSRIALGCGNFGGIGSVPELFGQGLTDDQAFALMDAAWDAGIDHFDTSRKGALFGLSPDMREPRLRNRGNRGSRVLGRRPGMNALFCAVVASL